MLFIVPNNPNNDECTVVHSARAQLMNIWAVSSSLPLKMALVFKNKHSSTHGHICCALLAHLSGLTSHMELNFDVPETAKKMK